MRLVFTVENKNETETEIVQLRTDLRIDNKRNIIIVWIRINLNIYFFVMYYTIHFY